MVKYDCKRPLLEPEVVNVPEGVSGAELSLAEFQTINIAMLYFKRCNIKGIIADKEIR